MQKKLVAMIAALAVLFSCACALADGELIVSDMYGRDVALDKPAERIVVLDAADCEILYALGAGEAVVGRGAYCDYPEAALAAPVVNSGAEMNVEEIIALEPDVVLMSAMAQTAEQVAALEAAGLAVIESYAQDIDGVYAAVEMIGQLSGKDGEAAALVADMKAAFAEVALQAAKNAGKTIYFEVSPLQWGLWTAGEGTFMDEIAKLCGLTNAFADVSGWAEISQEQVLARDPDYIATITMYYGEGPSPVEEILSRVGWADLKAVSGGSVYAANADDISRPGPRLVDAARALAAFIAGKDEASK